MTYVFQFRSSFLFYRKQVAVKAPHECETIEDIRSAIDAIDHEIVIALSRRFDYVKEVMRFKTTEDDVRAPQRYQAVLDQRRAWAEEMGFPPDVVEEMYRLLISYFIDHEMEELARNSEGQA